MRNGKGCCGGCCLPIVLLVLLAACSCLASPLFILIH